MKLLTTFLFKTDCFGLHSGFDWVNNSEDIDTWLFIFLGDNNYSSGMREVYKNVERTINLKNLLCPRERHILSLVHTKVASR